MIQYLLQDRKVSESETKMFTLFMQTALTEVREYNDLIAQAKTQAKRDFYKKKIKKVTNRLKKLLP